MIVKKRRNGDRENGTFFRRALHRDFTAHHIANSATDGQSQSGSAIYFTNHRITLGKRSEQDVDLVLAHADAGIGNSEDDGVRRLALVSLDTQNNLTVGRELAGVVEQVEKNLFEGDWVGVNRADVVGYVTGKRIAVSFH